MPNPEMSTSEGFDPRKAEAGGEGVKAECAPLLNSPERPSYGIAQALSVIERDGEELFDRETLDEIADMDYGEAFEVAYGYLTQAELDPEIVLEPWIDKPNEIQGTSAVE